MRPVLSHQFLSIITSISFDTDYLGDDIPSIAYEKGADIRNQTPVITGNLSGKRLG